MVPPCLEIPRTSSLGSSSTSPSTTPRHPSWNLTKVWPFSERARGLPNHSGGASCPQDPGRTDIEGPTGNHPGCRRPVVQDGLEVGANTPEGRDGEGDQDGPAERQQRVVDPELAGKSDEVHAAPV